MSMRKGIGIIGLIIVVWFLVFIGGLSLYYVNHYRSSSQSIADKSREAFSTVNIAELNEKSLTESVELITKKTTSDLAKQGGGINSWGSYVTRLQIEELLKSAIKSEIDGLQDFEIPGKSTSVSFSPASVEISTNSNWFSAYKFTIDVEKPFTLERSLPEKNLDFKLEDSGNFKEEIDLRYYPMAITGMNFFQDFDYKIFLDNGFSGASGLHSLKTRGSYEAYSSSGCDGCTCGSYPSVSDVLKHGTEWNNIDSTVSGVVNKINKILEDMYPYLVFEAIVEPTEINKDWDVETGSVSNSCRSEGSGECNCQPCEQDPESEEPCEPVCDTYYDCYGTTSATFKFTVNIILTMKQKDSYSVIPTGVSKTDYFPLKIDKTFKDLDVISYSSISNSDKKYMPIWFDSGGNYIVYGDEIKNTKRTNNFAFLGIDPDNKNKYVLWLNGISLNEIKDKDCNFFDGNECKNIPYNLVKMEVPFDFLEFILDFKHNTEWVNG